MIPISISKVQDVQKVFEEEINGHYEKTKKGLTSLSTNTTEPNDKAFVQQILTLFQNNSKILTADPYELKKLKTKIGAVPTIKKTNKDGKEKDEKSPIKDRIIESLGYKNLRNSFYPAYFANISIKACVYCNSQLTVSVVSKNKKLSGRFDVDHYYSKDEYPWLSTCLFNLYPSCASCNRRKSNNGVEFDLYTDDTAKLAKSEYSFKLDTFSKAKYLITKDYKDIDFIFNEPVYAKDIKSFEDTFKIKGIYSTQLDIIEELIAKSQMYDETYRKVLSDNFSKLSINAEVYKRIILGNYTNETEIHKRPMSKFMQDIAKDLGLLK